MGVWERDDVGHSPERAENIGWGNLMRCGLPECIFLEEEDQDHEVPILVNRDWEGKTETRKFQREGKKSIEDKIYRLWFSWGYLDNRIEYLGQKENMHWG